MSRELRRVPPNWQHPKDKDGHYVPLLGGPFQEELAAWEDRDRNWEQGIHPDLIKGTASKVDYPSYAEYGGSCPRAEAYMPQWKPEEATWVQVYESVTEGTPITPPFATKAQLIKHLVTKGDRTGEKWTPEQADYFVNVTEESVSLVSSPNGLINGFKDVPLPDVPSVPVVRSAAEVGSSGTSKRR